ncbi:MAG TPA: MFS transporter [Mycobacteriales bacterium]|nr:MFS transporter [Mycobacteriales bacterium]
MINRNYARLWYGQATSLLGDFVFDTTLVLWVGTVLARGQSWAPVAVSGVLVAVAVGTLVAPVAGVLVDRWNRRRTMLRADAFRAVLVGVLAVLSFLPTDRLPVAGWLVLVYLVVVLINGAQQFFGPARVALISDVVSGDKDRARASGIGQTTLAVMSIVGPPLAAPLLFTAGVSWALLLNAASFVVSYLAIRSVRVTDAPVNPERPAPEPAGPTGPAGGRRMRDDFVDGLRFVGSSRVLVTLLVVIVVGGLGTGAMNALDVFFVSDNLHVAPHWYGTLGMALGIGSVIGAVLGSGVTNRFGAARTVYVGLLATGLLIMVYARLGNLGSAIVLQVVLGVPLAALHVALVPLVLRATPQEYLGRVASLVSLFQQIASTVSVVVAGWLASTVLLGLHASVAGIRFGRIDTIFLVSGLLIVVCGGYAAVGLRGSDSPAPASPAGPEPAAQPTG